MNVRRRMAASVLTFEAIVVLFAPAVAIQLSGVRPAVAVGTGVGVAVLCLLTAGLLRHRWAFALGSALQVAVVASGVVVPAMYVLGVIFAALWFFALHLGARAVALERAHGAARGEDVPD